MQPAPHTSKVLVGVYKLRNFPQNCAEDNWGVLDEPFMQLSHELEGCRPNGNDHVEFAVGIFLNKLFTKPALRNFVWKQGDLKTLMIKLDLVRRFLQSKEDCLTNLCEARGWDSTKVIKNEYAPDLIDLSSDRTLQEEENP